MIKHDLSPVTKLFHRPYVRSMFAFILTADGNDLQYECVLVRISYFLSLVSFPVNFFSENSISIACTKYLNKKIMHLMKVVKLICF